MILENCGTCSLINPIDLKTCSLFGVGKMVERRGLAPIYGNAPIMPLAWVIVSSHAR